VLVALDSNVIDLIEMACSSREHIDAIESCAPPPPYRDVAPHLEGEVLACHWILALAPSWTSTIYTFSDRLYGEIGAAKRAPQLLRVAFDVLIREEQLDEVRVPDADRRPSSREVELLGVKPADALHVADAIGLACGRLLTNDRQLRSTSDRVESRWGLGIRRPSEFVAEAVSAGAPWTTLAPWPWEVQ
jgi:predicted nucleic acid-binding protein